MPQDAFTMLHGTGGRPGGGKKQEEEATGKVSWSVEETDGARWVLSE